VEAVFEMNVELRAAAESQATIYGAFANAKRVMILWSLADQEMPVGEIAAAIGASMQCTSQHLRLMKDLGILESRRDGQMIYYRIVDSGPTESCQLLIRACRKRPPGVG
jgi:DNA-binding transcriptional ArsR family regulator